MIKINFFLQITILSFIFFSNAYSDDKMYSPSDDFVKNYFSKMTVADVMIMGTPNALTQISANAVGVQYHFIISMKKVTGPVPVICFVSSTATKCRVP